MTDLKKGQQKGEGSTGGVGEPRESPGEHNEGTEFGTAERATRGTDRDADRSGRSANEGHGHPREERGENRES